MARDGQPDQAQPDVEVLAGDCVPVMRELGRAGRRFDLVFCDPPFDIGLEYDVYRDRLGLSKYLDWTKEWATAARDLLRPDGSFWVAIGSNVVSEVDVAVKSLGLHLRSHVVWYYTFGPRQKNGFTPSHVHLLYYVKDPDRFTFNAPAVSVPSARQLVYNDKRAVPQGRLPDNTWVLRPQWLEELGGLTADHDLWHVPRVCGTYKERQGFHVCQMPEAVLARIVLACTAPGDSVLDPMAGSGTTPVVAKKLGRCGLGIELSENYARKAAARLAACKAGDPVAGGELYLPKKRSRK